MTNCSEFIFINDKPIMIKSYVYSFDDYSFEFRLDNITKDMNLTVHVLFHEEEIYEFNTNISSIGNKSKFIEEASSILKEFINREISLEDTQEYLLEVE